MNKNKPNEQKRYYTFSRYLKEQFGERVHKIAIDAGFTCPNLDGLKSTGGCTYCNQEGFSYNSRREILPISTQIKNGIQFMKKRFKCRKFLAYFQAFSNTYAPVPELKKIYDHILDYPEEIVGFSVSTRPDTISNANLDLLTSYQDNYEVWLELGLQSCHNETLDRINRHHTFEHFVHALLEAKQRNLKVCVHVILGLPGESFEDMLKTAQALSSLPFDSLKIHLLHVMKNTQMEQEYYEGKIDLLSMEEYINCCVNFLEYIPPHVSIQRLTADAPSNVLIAPLWCQQRHDIYQAIDKELELRNSYQGMKLNKKVKVQVA